MKTIKLKKDKSNFKYSKADANLIVDEKLSPLIEKILVISEFSGECHEFKFSELTKTGVVVFTKIMAKNPVKTVSSIFLDSELDNLKAQLLHKYDELFEYSGDSNYVKDQRHIKSCLVKLGVLK